MPKLNNEFSNEKEAIPHGMKVCLKYNISRLAGTGKGGRMREER